MTDIELGMDKDDEVLPEISHDAPYVYRAMREDALGRPMIGPTARILGVRPDDDIPVVEGIVKPGTGGLSVAPDDPSFLPEHRRPPEYQGSGKDPLWKIRRDMLGDNLACRRDKTTHGLFEPAREMPIESFQEELAALAPKWSKL